MEFHTSLVAAIEGMSGALRGELAPLGISVTIVEPGVFRTDFAGRSLIQSATVIDDYAATAGRRRKENETMHGNQAGDPGKAAAAIIAAVESAEPLPHSCSSAPTPWPHIATSQTRAQARSGSGNSSRPALTSPKASRRSEADQPAQIHPRMHVGVTHVDLVKGVFAGDECVELQLSGVIQLEHPGNVVPGIR